jgi:hypothetical protein
MGEENCMCIAAGASTSQKISPQARGKECQKGDEPNHFATVCRSEPSSKRSAAAANNSGPKAGGI